MTTTDDRTGSKTACPAWCTNAVDCDEGYHSDDYGYIPASGAACPAEVGSRGAQWPVIAVSLDVVPDRSATICVWLTGVPGVEAEVYLRPHEARELIEAGPEAARPARARHSLPRPRRPRAGGSPRRVRAAEPLGRATAPRPGGSTAGAGRWLI